MTSSKDFCQSVVQHLNQLGPVTSRAMFGGYGLYLEGIMFALIADKILYFKVGDVNHEDYINAGMEPFTYEGKAKPVQMSYFQVPVEVYKDLAILQAWMDKALTVAKAVKRRKKA